MIAQALSGWSPWAAGAFLASAAVGLAAVWLTGRRRRALGYWVEYLSPAQVRGEAGAFCVVYHERGLSLWLSGRELSPPARWKLRVPDAAGWRRETAEWAHDRRDEILERVRANAIVARRCELEEASAA